MSFSRSNHHNANFNSRFKHNRTKRFDHYVDVSGEAPAKSNVEVAFLNFLRDAGHHQLKMANKVMFNEDSLRFSVRLFGRRNDLHHFRKEFQSHLAPVFFGKRLSVSKVSETRHSRHEPSRMGTHRRPQPVWYYATTDKNDSFLPLDPEVSIRLEEGRRSQEVEIVLNGSIYFIVKLHDKLGLMMKTKTSSMDDGRVVVRCQGLADYHHPKTTTQVIQHFLNLSLTNPLNRPEFWNEESSSGTSERYPILRKCGSKLNVINSSTNTGLFIARNIAQLFEKSMSTTEYEILSIHLVEHPILFQSYQNFRVARSLQSPNFDLNEKLLFFGGSKTDIDRCLRRGFLREYEEQTLMGRGVYFSKDANAAAIRSSPDATHMHVRRVICAMVVCGESMTSSPTMIRPPLKHDSEVEYETLVDNLMDPNTFVIPNDNQAYPLAEIEFTRKFDETASTTASVASTLLTPPLHGIRRATPESSASPQALYHQSAMSAAAMGTHSMNNFAVSMGRSSGIGAQQVHPMTTPFIGVPPATVWVQQSMPQSMTTGCPQQMGQTQFMHMPVGRNGMHFEGTVTNAPKNFVMTHSRVG